MDKRSDPEKSRQTNVPVVPSVAPVPPLRLKPSTMNWLMSRGFAAMAPRVPRPPPMQPPTPQLPKSRPLGPRSPAPRSSGSRSSGPRSSGPRSPGPRSSGPRSPGPRSSGPRSPEPRSPGPQSPPSRPLEPRPLELRPSGPRSMGPRPLGPRPVGPRPLGPRSLGPRSFGPRPFGPPLPIVPPNMNILLGEMPNPPVYGYMPAVVDEHRFRRRRQVHTRTNPAWTLSGINLQSLLSNINSHQSARKVVSVTYTDPTGGSMIVSRRREDGNLDVRMVYSREFIVAASASPLALLPPPNFRHMVLNMMEIIAKFPKSYHNTVSQDSSSSSSE
ncbi:hypothetical protein LOAG_07858 [Loa loa]|uniref:Uncharacterized protein n=1 Tax=Loa loa TaxID=7209 RepID=A0A1S0TUZ8_LOALO|nr:hypothetical protein LOAG_07858 [Loa loa]EFO20628.2 hypothetical protein LOAG_07858 [Loa loa]